MKFNIAHTAATAFRKVAVATDKLPTPGEILRKAANAADAANSEAFKARKAELAALELAVATKFVSADTTASAPATPVEEAY